MPYPTVWLMELSVKYKKIRCVNLTPDPRELGEGKSFSLNLNLSLSLHFYFSHLFLYLYISNPTVSISLSHTIAVYNIFIHMHICSILI